MKCAAQRSQALKEGISAAACVMFVAAFVNLESAVCSCGELP